MDEFKAKKSVFETFVCRSSLYQGLFPVLVTLCCSNFVYFYTYNGLKTTLLEEGSKPGPVKDLLMAFVSGSWCILYIKEIWELI